MAAKKTRFIVGMEGRELELFSVTENKNGGLTVVLPILEQQSAIHLAHVDHRFSIHETLKAHDGGFQITETILRSDGNKYKNYAYVKPNGANALLPVFSRVAASFRRSPDIKGKKRVATVTVYDAFPGGPMFFVLTASQNVIEKEHFPTSMKLTSMSFKRYHLYVCSGIFHSAALGSAITRTLMTHGPAFNDVKSHLTHNVDVPEPISPTPDQVSFLIEEAVDALSAQLKTAATSLQWEGVRPRGEKLLSIILNYDRYSAYPGSRYSTHIPQARERRLSHPPTGLWLPPEGAEATFHFPEPTKTDLNPKN